jgi:hypothetical protein
LPKKDTHKNKTEHTRKNTAHSTPRLEKNNVKDGTYHEKIRKVAPQYSIHSGICPD